MTHTLGDDLTKVELSDTDERARAAVKAFRAMQPGLTGMARALSRNPKVQVILSSSNGQTDGTRIFYRPPIALGDKRPHDRAVCDRRDSYEQLLCPACNVRESVLGTIYHELGHIIFETFGPVSDADKAEAIKRAISEHGTKYSAKIEAAIRGQHGNDYINLSNVISPYLSLMFNGLEDARIERSQANARPGTRVMFRSKIARIAAEGVEVQDPKTGAVEHVEWSTRPLNSQICVGLYVKSAGYTYQHMFHEDVVAALGDEIITDLCGRVAVARSSADVYKLGFPILARMRELGFLKSDKEPEDVQDEPEPEPQSDPEEPDDSEGDANEAQDDSGGGNDQQESDGEDSMDEDSSASDPADGVESDDSSEQADETSDGSGSDDADNASDGDSDGAGSDSDGSQESAAPSESGDKEGDELDDSESNSPGEGGTGEGEPQDGSSADGQPGGESDSDQPGPAGDGDSESNVGDGAPGADSADAGDDSSDSDESSHDPEGVSDADSEGSQAGSTDDAGVGQDIPGSGDDRDGDLGDDGSGESSLPVGDGTGAASPVVDQGGDLDDGSKLDNLSDDMRPGSPDLERAVGDNSPTGEHEDNSTDGLHEDRADPEPSRGESEKRDVEIDTGADQGKGGSRVEGEAPRPTMGDESDAEAALIKWMDHEDPPKSVEQKHQEANETSSIDKAIIQGIYFETPSENVYGVTERRWSDPDREEAHCWDRERSTSGYSRRSEAGDDDDFETPESLLGPALLQMRRTFADNARASFLRHQKSGRVNGAVLGKRAALGDERLFQQKRLPGKRNYHVVIMMDISYSTVGVNIGIMKHAVIAQTQLLDRMGIPFSIYAHTSDLHIAENGDYGTNMEVYVIREPGEPWDSAKLERISSLGPGRGNLDGHAMEYMRKHLDAVHATHKVGLYYSDGKMPAENHDEELEVLQREIAVIRKKRYALLGVGIRTDSPTQHGLETVQLDDVADTDKVVQQLRAKILEIS